MRTTDNVTKIIITIELVDIYKKEFVLLRKSRKIFNRCQTGKLYFCFFKTRLNPPFAYLLTRVFRSFDFNWKAVRFVIVYTGSRN